MQRTTQKKTDQSIIIYTDGSSLGNPGPGGFGCVIVFQDRSIVTELGGRDRATTNNRMELTAIMAALSHVKQKKIAVDTPILIHTDSSYAINGITKWVHGWQKNNWITSTKTPVINVDLWKPLIALNNHFKNISLIHVRGHAGVWGNERCDMIATSYAQDMPVGLFHGKLSDYDARILSHAKHSSHAQSSIAVSQKKKSANGSGKAYAYVAQVNGKVQIFSDWESCKSHVYGRSAKYKKVFSKEEQDALIQEWK